jgi:hypothetical protein
MRCNKKANSPLLELARVLVRPDHVASFIVNPNHSIVRPAAKLRLVNCAGGRTGSDRNASRKFSAFLSRVS